ncbi:MAG: PAS domain S-box protein, partial [Bacteroidales bacterium]
MESIDETNNFRFDEIFDLKEIQQIQDLFSDATGVASIITHPDGTPITAPSNFTHLCNNIIRKTEKGCRNCFKSDAIIGGYNKSGATVQPCLSGGLWDAGACITVGDKHIANWLIGQVRSGDLKEPRWIKYADEIGADRNEFMQALADVPVMPVDKFIKMADMLFAFANQLSEKAYQNLLLKNEISEREKATVQLQHNKENLAITLNSIGDGVITTDNKGLIININPIAEALCGCTLSEALGKPLSEVFQIINPITRETIPDPVKKVLESGTITSLASHTTLISKTGDEYMIADSAAPIKNEEGKISGVILVFSDVTEKQETQEKIKKSEEKFQALYYNMAEGAALHEIVYDSQGVAIDYVIIETNPAFGLILGIDRTTLNGKTSREAYKVDEPPFFETYLQVALSGEAKVFETYFPPLDKHFSISVYSPYKGSFATIFNDITERKLSEAALQINEAKYRKDFSLLHSLIESPIDIIVFALDLNYCYTAFTNFHKETIKKIWGVDIHTGMNMLDCISDPEDKKKAKANFDRVLKGDYFTLTEEYGDKMFSRIWYDNYYSAIKDADGNIIGLSVFVIDVTSRRFAEEELRLSKTAVSSLLGNLRGMVYSCSNDKYWSMEFVSEGSLELTGYLNEEFTSKKTILFNEIILPDDREYVWQTIQDAIKEKAHYELEYQIVTKNGSVKNVWERGLGIFNADGSLNHLEGFIADISRQKQSEEALQQAEYKYRYLLENSGIGIGLYSLEGEILLFNSKALQNLGGKLEDYVGKTIAEAFGQKTASEYFSRIKDLGKANKSVEYEDSVPLATGNFWFLSNYTLIKGIDGKILGVQVISHDISERKKAEQEIQKLGKHYQALIENAPDGIVQIDAIGNYKYASPSARKIFGYSLDQDLAEIHRNDKMHPEDKEMVLAEMVKIIKNPLYSPTLQYRFSHVNGQWRWVESSFTNLLSDPIIGSIVINFRDITERKAIEQKLSNNQAELKALYDNSPIMMCVVDQNRQILFANQAFTELTGTPEDLLKGGHACGVFGCINADESGCGFGTKCHDCKLRQAMEDTIKNGSGHKNIEYQTTLVQNGVTQNISLLGSTALIQTAEKRQLLLCLHDITDRKTVEAELQESEAKYKNLFEANSDGLVIFRIDKNGYPSIFQETNESSSRLLGYTKEEFLHLTTLDIEIKKTKEEIEKQIEDFNKQGYTTFETLLKHKNGNVIHVEIKALVIEFKKQPAIMGIIRDITERKKIEASLKVSEEKFRYLVRDMQVGVLLQTPEAEIVLSNPKALELLGLTNDQLLGKTSFDPDWNVIHEDGSPFPGNTHPVPQAIETHKPVHNVVMGVYRPLLGDRVWLLVDAEPQLNSDGSIDQVVCSFVDITKRIKAEEALLESEIKFREMADLLPQIVFETDVEGKLTYVNKQAFNILGYPDDYPVIGLNTLDLYTPESKARAIENIRNVILYPHKVVSNEYTMLRRDGTTFQALVYSNQIVKNNIPIGLRGIIVDISYRIKAEEAIKKSEERFRVLFEGAPDAIILADPETRKLLDANNAASRLLGKERSEIVGMYQHELHPQNIVSESKSSFDFHVLKAKQEGFTQTVEKEVIRSDGSKIPVEILGQSILLDGKMVFMGTFRDISERKQAQEAQRKSESIYKAILLASPDAITISNLEGNYVMVSPSALALVGIKKEEEMLGRNFTEFIAPDDSARALSDATLLSQGIKTGPNQYRGLRPDGQSIDIEVNGALIKDASGNPLNFVFSVRDITERRKAELEVQLKNKELQKIYTEKDKFFSIIAHDLRSPFNGFLGLTQIMAEDLPSLTMSEIQNIAVSMRNSATNLYRLLENLLHWTRIEQGLIPFNPETLEFKPIVDESLAMVIELALKKEIEISYDIQEGTRVYADSNILQTLLRNLVSNAIKFTPKEGKINLSAKSENNSGIRICIQDSGIGMDKEMIEKLFQIDKNTSRKGTDGEPSTGLGLIICKDFVEKHGGK